MNNTDKEYFRLIDLVLEKGRRKKNRTGIDTIGMFGAQARFDLSEGFSLLTTKKVFIKGIIHELLWFLKGDRNIKYLVDNGVNIWNGNCYDKYRKTPLRQFTYKDVDVSKSKHHTPEVGLFDLFSEEQFIEKIKNDIEFSNKYGDLGEGTYGGMWRAFPFYDDEQSFMEKTGQKLDLGFSKVPHIQDYHAEDWVFGKLDQIQKLIDKLKSNPDDRRLIVSSWHPYWIDHCSLPPCHCLFQFHTEELTLEERWALARKNGKFPGIDFGICGTCDGSTSEVLNEMNHEQIDRVSIPRRRLNCQLYQRSADLFLGVPFNIASYALLTSMIAHCVDMAPGEFVHTFGDLHLYENTIEQAKLQRSRDPKRLPKLVLNNNIKNIFDFKFEDISIEGYDSHTAIKAEMAV